MAIRYPIVFKVDKSGLGKAESTLGKFGKNLGKIAAGATAAVAGIAAKGIAEFAQFDSALNKSLAIMGDVSDALRDEMATAAREVATETKFSAEQAAESYFFLASAGLDATQSIAAMPQVAKFAQAGMFDMALATDLATDAQSALGLASDDAETNLQNLTRVTDVFVKANTLANTSVEQLATAFTTKAGTALKTVNKEVEEGAAVLAVFADQGIKGERAGTLLTNTIFGLTDILKKAPAEAEELGLQIFDASGEMRTFADISRDLTGILGPMTKEQQIATLSQLGFTKQAREGTLALLGNADAIEEYEGKLKSAGGTAETVAQNQMQTLEAQMGLVKAQFEDVAIAVGSELAPVFVDLAKDLTPTIKDLTPALVTGFRSLIPAIQSIVGLIPRLIPIFVALIGPLIAIVDVVLKLAEMVLPIFLSVIESIIPMVQQILPLFVALVNQALQPLAEAALGVVQQLFPLIQQVLPALVQLVMSLVPIMIQLAQDVLVPLAPVVMSLVEAFIPLIQMVLPILIGLIQVLVPVITFLAQMLGGVLVFAIQTVVNIMKFFQGVVKAVGQGFMEFWTGFIQPALSAIGAFFTSIFNDVIQPLFEGFKFAIGLIASVFTLVFDGVIMPLLGVFGDFFRDLVKNIVEPLSKNMNFIFEGVGKAFDFVYNNVIEPALDAFGKAYEFVFENFIEPISDFITGAFEGVSENAKNIFTFISDFIKDTFENLVGFVKGPINSIIDFVNGLINSLNTIKIDLPPIPFFGFPGASFGVSIPNIPQLAEGGIVMPRPGGVLANIAEGGQAEAVIPLDRAGQFGGGNTINIEVNAGMGSDPVAVGREVVNAIKRYEATNGRVFVGA